MKVLALMLTLIGVAHAGAQIKGQANSQEFLYDFNISGGATGTIQLSLIAGYPKLPQGAVVKDMGIKVIKALTSSGAASVSFGNLAAFTAYGQGMSYSGLVTGTVASGETLKGDAIFDDANDVSVPYLIDSDNKARVAMRVNTANLTGGKFILWLNYFYPSK